MKEEKKKGKISLYVLIEEVDTDIATVAMFTSRWPKYIACTTISITQRSSNGYPIRWNRRFDWTTNGWNDPRVHGSCNPQGSDGRKGKNNGGPKCDGMTCPVIWRMFIQMRKNNGKMENKCDEY
jgi:hypothetical protein